MSLNSSQDEKSDNTPSTPHLLPEIWSMVLLLVKKPKPSASESSSRIRRTSEVRKYAQGDLAACMQVCREFHYLTAPRLYEEAIVDDLGRFFYGINVKQDQAPTSPPSLSKGLLGKIELFTYIKAFHIVHHQPTPMESSRLVPHCERVSLIVDNIVGRTVSQKVLASWLRGNKSSSFPNLEYTTTGAYRASDWDRYDSGWNGHDPEWRAKAQSMFEPELFARLMGLASTPTHSCSYVNKRPQAYLPPTAFNAPSNNRLEGSPRLEYYTCHITQRMVESKTDIRIVTGFRNRWVVSHEFATRNASTNHDMVLWLCDQLQKADDRLSSGNEVKKDTSIANYNVLIQHTAKSIVKYQYDIRDSSYDFLGEGFLKGSFNNPSIKLMKEPAEVCPACGA
ncbi:hypothetical protein V865_008485 [Kwoniella europaea PYCC6329]|uniref:F-box domain-containing protein n=1 Tax=Kwoniella europaea PYCC6329 TaxID=1423913 RepID=A0AAX4KXJ8_9TREE